MNQKLPIKTNTILDNSVSALSMKISFFMFSLLCLGIVLSQSNFKKITNDLSSNQNTPELLTGNNKEAGNIVVSTSDVVTKALAFKAMLTTAQQATLEQTYTTTLVAKWSNLPCGSGCRNGIQLSTLTAAQLTAALEVIQAASGTTTNEGYDEFNQIRSAEEQLQATAGGTTYDEGIYFISFLNTPSATGAWMLQYGGHHNANNIAFNAGNVVGATPMFEGVEPKSWTSGGVTYAPLATEHDAMANMLASLTTTQLSTAKLSSTFSDVTMAPGATNGNTNSFPTTKVGLAVSTLTSAQKLLVLEAMKPWVQDVDDTSAASLLSIYENELSATYISYTGAGSSGSASTFLTANTNYVRIDGTSVWIEFVCQTGVVFPSQIHYHSVWRDHTRDYGANLANTTLSVNSVNDNSKSIQIYPNPTSDLLFITLETELEKGTIVIYDLNGKIVLTSKDNTGTTIQLSISSLAKGNYIVKGVYNNGQTFTSKFIKK